MPEGTRRLAAIMFTDMVGYAALTQSNESLAMQVLDRHSRLLMPFFPKFHGREVKAIGDSFLIEFESALDAVNCALEIQSFLHDYNISSRDEWKINLRIGIHLGDVIHQSGDMFGDAVNIASRIEPIAEPEGICISEQVYDQVQNKVAQPLTKLRSKDLKNIKFPIDVYRVVMPWEREDTSEESKEVQNFRLAVLPLVNMSPDPTDEFFADGLTEELISTMSKMSELRVISRTSVMQYKGKSKSIGEIGRELKAGRILEGSVRKAANRVRVTIQMIDTSNDLHLWADSYDRELQDIFAIQSEIAKQVASTLRVQILSGEKRDIEKKPTVSTEAYQLYLKGRHHFRQYTKEDNNKALEYFRKATDIDPRFSLAYAAISDCYHWGSHYNWFSPEEGFPLMKEYAAKALEADSRSAEGTAALAAVHFHYEWKWREAENELKRAIELKPSYDSAYRMYAPLLAINGRFDESYEQARRSAELTPEYDDREWGFALSWALIRLGRVQDGIARLEEISRVNPDSANAHLGLGFAYYLTSRMEDAISEVRNAVKLSRGDLAFKGRLATLLALAGQKDEASSILNELEESSRNTYVSSIQVACILHSLGRKDEAFDSLEQAYQRREIDLPYIRLWPQARGLLNDPRWISLEGRMGLSVLPACLE